MYRGNLHFNFANFLWQMNFSHIWLVSTLFLCNLLSENGARVAFVIFKDSGATDTAILLSVCFIFAFSFP